MSGLDPSTLAAGAVGIISLANIGGIIYLVKVVIAPVVESVNRLNKSVEDLFESRKSHEVEITRIQTIHKLKGCDLPPEHNKR